MEKEKMERKKRRIEEGKEASTKRSLREGRSNEGRNDGKREEN